MRSVRALAVAALLLLAAYDVALAGEPKQGGILRMYHRDSPGSASIHEGATYSVNVPFMPVFNNLVIFDQNIAQNSVDTIVPDLAESWAWSDDNKTLTFKLQQGVKWHDGKPFTSADVKCTFDMLMGKSQQKFRQNPRKSWYDQVNDVTDQRRLRGVVQPEAAAAGAAVAARLRLHAGLSLPRLAGARCAPTRSAPARSSSSSSRPTNRSSSTKNPGLLQEGPAAISTASNSPSSPNRSTAILGFVSGKFDMTFPTEVSIPLLKDVKSQAPNAVCVVEPINVSHQHHRQLVLAAVRQSRHPPRAGAGARPQGVHLDPVRGPGRYRRHHAAGAGRAVGACRRKCWRRSRATAPTSNANREEARKLMQKAGYGPDKHLAVKVSTRNIPVYRDPAVILIDQLKSIYIDAELDVVDTAQWFPKVARKDYTLGLNLTGNARRRSRPVVLRELFLRLGAQLHQLLQQGDREAVRPAIAGDRRRQAQEAGLGDRQEAAGGRGAPDHLPRARRAPAGSPMSRASPSW